MNIVVLAGGISPERDVSLNSGKMIYNALKNKGHQVLLLDVYLGYQMPGGGAADRHSLFAEEIDWVAGITAIGSESPDLSEIKARRPDGDKNFFGPNVIALCQAADITFIALHGESGENGKIQACFDLMGITYTGADYLGSALAMDKVLAKELFQYHGLVTPAGVAIHKDSQSDKRTVPLTATSPISYPCIVKASGGGSSVGVKIANNDEEYAEALAEAYRYDEIALVETYIRGREFSVGVLGGKALPVIEIAPKQGFFDYKNKYQPGATVETCPALLAPEKTLEMQQIAEKVFKILRLSNFARMDFMMDEQEKIYCLEANTVPGMAPTSLLPQEAAAAGIDFGSLCEKIIEAALPNQQAREPV
jgi:D-alanine-D-alanine ligase